MGYNPASIPADIKKDGYVLLVLKQEVGGFREYRTVKLKNLCAGIMALRFEMVSTDDLKNTKYDDTDKYRYAIGRDFNSGLLMTTRRSTGTGAGTSTTHRQYHTRDNF